MRVVIDTNVDVSRYLAPYSTPARVLLLWEGHVFDLVVSPPILDEYKRVLGEPHIRRYHQKSDKEIATIIRRIRSAAIRVRPTQKFSVVPDDPDDDKFIECAVAGNAGYVVTGDKHLLALGSYQGIQIVPPAAFVNLFATDESVEP